MYRTLCLVVLLLAVAFPLFSQVRPSATESGFPLVVGVGFSDYNVDWGHGRMEGGALWIDWTPRHIPRILRGVGIEVEARDISIGHSSSQPANFRLDTAGGGVIYAWQHFHNFHPYAKYLVSFGGIDWNNPNPQFDHETRTVTAPGLGLEYKVFRNVWVRADYEYQFWPGIAIYLPGKHVLDPQGFTVGASYDFRHIHSY